MGERLGRRTRDEAPHVRRGDATPSARAYRQLAASPQFYQSLFEHNPDAVYALDLDGCFTDVNPGAIRMTGYTRDELVGESLARLVTPECLDRVVASFNEVVRGTPQQLAADLRHRDGHVLHVRCVKLPIIVDGGVVGVFGLAVDFTAQREAEQERARAEELLRQREQRFRALVEHSWDLVTIMDEHRRCSYASPSYERILGYSPAELVGRDMTELIHPDDLSLADEQLGAALAHGPLALPQPIRFGTRGGEWRSIESFVTDLRDDPAVGGLVANSRDVTDRQLLEEQLRHVQKMDAIGRLSGAIAHDFNNLLMAVAGNAELALRSLPGDSPARPELEEIVRAAERATALSRQLLAFSRKQVQHPTVLDVNEVILEMRRMFDRLLGARIHLHTDLAENLRPVRADRTQLEQVLMNLALNARDAMPDGGDLTIATANVRPNDAAGPRLSTRGQLVRVTVRDTGHGMNDEVRARAFEPFFTTKEHGRGTGLGLATVYGIVTQSGGQLTLDSRPGQGSTFTMLFPAAREETHDEARDPRVSPHAHARSAGVVLVVDDQAPVRRVVERILKSAGYRVVTAKDGLSALTVVDEQGEELTLVVTDADMPNMGGHELAAAIAERQLDVPVMIISGHAPETLAHAAGPDGTQPRVLQKPFTIDELLDAVRHTITEHAQRNSRLERLA